VHPFCSASKTPQSLTAGSCAIDFQTVPFSGKLKNQSDIQLVFPGSFWFATIKWLVDLNDVSNGKWPINLSSLKLDFDFLTVQICDDEKKQIPSYSRCSK
jgi:hypothetical protein